MPNLRKLDAEGTDVNDEVIECLATKCKGLSELHISIALVTDRSLDALLLLESLVSFQYSMGQSMFLTSDGVLRFIERANKRILAAANSLHSRVAETVEKMCIEE